MLSLSDDGMLLLRASGGAGRGRGGRDMLEQLLPSILMLMDEREDARAAVVSPRIALESISPD